MDWLISNAHAQTGGGAPPDAGMANLIFILVLFAVLYFFMIRPQMKKQKEHRQMVEALNKGDEIITNGGIFGKILEVGESLVVLEVNDGVQLKVQKFAVAKTLPKGTLKSLK
ncbi:MAG: preprotein translocase subunit YajC [Xanthomonadales bacterium]|nr:preprotein translocase subunit YajC [Xanthomonadales bacterium]